MDDRGFLRLFHEGHLPGEEFRHRGHLRLAWLVLSHHTRAEPEQIVAREIQQFAVANGASGKYHDTLTRFWVRLVGHAMENAPAARSIDELLGRFPFLLDKGLPYRHCGERRSTRILLVPAGLNQTYFHYPDSHETDSKIPGSFLRA